MLYGPSGAGKSSFLRAGLVHRLRRTTATEPSDLGAPGTIVVVLDEWLGDPAAELWRAVAGAGPAAEAGAGAELGERSLHDALRGLSETLNVEFLIVMDQFEDYLAAHPPDSGDQLDAELPGLVADRDVPVRFLIALRDDALAGLDRFKGRIPDLFDNYLRLDRLGEHAAREAIEGPVRHWNSVSPEPMELEEGLADEVLRQLVGGDDAVPTAATPVGGAQIEPAHLQLVMTRLWEAETEAGSRVLRLATLESLGGAAAIVRNNVQAAMSSLPPRDQRLAAQVVRFLVTPSGAKVRHVPGDLAEYAGRPEPQVRALLERLSSGGLRILRPAPPPPGSSAPAAYEVFHDVLSSAARVAPGLRAGAAGGPSPAPVPRSGGRYRRGDLDGGLPLQPGLHAATRAGHGGPALRRSRRERSASGHRHGCGRRRHPAPATTASFRARSTAGSSTA